MLRQLGSQLVVLLLVCAAAHADDPKPQPKAGKLDVTRTIEIGADEAKGFQLAPQPPAQTIAVKFASSKGEVSVYLFPAAEIKGTDALFSADAKKALVGKTGKTGEFSAEVAANTEVVVVIRGIKEKTSIELKLSNETPDAKDARIKKLEEENAALRKEIAELQRQIADLKKQLEKK